MATMPSEDCCGPTSQGVNLPTKGTHPVLLEHLYRLLRFIHPYDDYGLATPSPTQIGIEIEDIDVSLLEGL